MIQAPGLIKMYPNLWFETQCLGKQNQIIKTSSSRQSITVDFKHPNETKVNILRRTPRIYLEDSVLSYPISHIAHSYSRSLVRNVFLQNYFISNLFFSCSKVLRCNRTKTDLEALSFGSRPPGRQMLYTFYCP